MSNNNQPKEGWGVNNKNILLEYINRAYPSGNIAKLLCEVLLEESNQTEQRVARGTVGELQHLLDSGLNEIRLEEYIANLKSHYNITE